MAGKPEHEDVGAGAEDLVPGAGDHHRAHFRVLEADAIDGVVEFDVDAEIVAVQLELVARADAGALVEIGDEGCDRALEAKLPVPVARGRSLVVDRVGAAHRALLKQQFNA